MPLIIIKKTSHVFFITTLILTSLTLLPFAIKIHGSSRWINLFGLSFQPSEFLKISFILHIASILSKEKHHVYSFIKENLPLWITLLATSFILLKQPDFGTTIILLLTAFIMLFTNNFNFKKLVFYSITFASTSIVLILLQPYRMKRIITFLNPWNDPKGSGFQIIQSLIAIGSGGFLGSGISYSKQKFFYLPMHHTDFIFSIIAEETGFLGATFLILLYLLFLYLGFKITWHMKDKFCFLATLGFTSLIGLQTIINLFVTTGLLPTKGIGLPFVSYGNSSLICYLCIIGIILNMAKNKKLNTSF